MLVWYYLAAVLHVGDYFTMFYYISTISFIILFLFFITVVFSIRVDSISVTINKMGTYHSGPNSIYLTVFDFWFYFPISNLTIMNGNVICSGSNGCDLVSRAGESFTITNSCNIYRKGAIAVSGYNSKHQRCGILWRCSCLRRYDSAWRCDSILVCEGTFLWAQRFDW